MTSRAMAASSRRRSASPASKSRRRDASSWSVRSSSWATWAASSACSRLFRNARAACSAMSATRATSCGRAVRPGRSRTLSSPRRPARSAIGTMTRASSSTATGFDTLRRPDRRRRAPVLDVEHHPHLVRRHRPTDGLGHRGEQRVGRRALTEPAAEVGQRVVRRRARAVGEPVGEAHHRAAQRLERHRDDCCRDDRRPEPLDLPAEHGSDPDDQGDVADRDEQRRHTEDDGPVDDQLHVVQPVPQDGDGEAHRQQQERDLQRHGGRPGRARPPFMALDDDQHRQTGRDEGGRGSDPSQLLPGLTTGSPEAQDHGDDRGHHGTG